MRVLPKDRPAFKEGDGLLKRRGKKGKRRGKKEKRKKGGDVQERWKVGEEKVE